MTTKSKYSPTKPFLPPEVMNCNKEKMVSTNKIVIDLQKEFDEDKELLDLLNNTQKQGKSVNKKYTNIKDCDIIPEVEENKLRTSSKLSKSKTSTFQEDEDLKNSNNYYKQFESDFSSKPKEKGTKNFSKSQKAISKDKIIIINKEKQQNNIYFNSESPSTTEVTHDSFLRAKSRGKYQSHKDSLRNNAYNLPSDLFKGIGATSTRHKTPPENHLILPKLDNKILQSINQEKNQIKKRLSNGTQEIDNIELESQQRIKGRNKVASAPGRAIRINNNNYFINNAYKRTRNQGIYECKEFDSIKINNFYNYCLKNN